MFWLALAMVLAISIGFAHLTPRQTQRKAYRRRLDCAKANYLGAASR